MANAGEATSLIPPLTLMSPDAVSDIASAARPMKEAAVRFVSV